MYRAGLKRAFDVIVAVMALILLLPLTVLTATAVFFSMGRPILFRQRRPGQNERTFLLYKFRTMTEDRDPRGELVPEDRRLTRVGRWIRKFSLDEIPQLWNVLKGEMSLVGPRPLLMEYLGWYTDRERKRHLVRPGITGLSQVSGRNRLDWDTRLEYDAWYVEHLSFRLDLIILWKTARQALFGRDVLVTPGSAVAPLNHTRAGDRRFCASLGDGSRSSDKDAPPESEVGVVGKPGTIVKR